MSPRKGPYLWGGAALGAVGGFLASSFVGNLGIALGVGAILGIVFSQAVYHRK